MKTPIKPRMWKRSLSSPSLRGVDPKRAAWHVLRVGAALCFIGHGAFGIITKEAWLPYFGLVGISPDLAYSLMPVVGCVDIGVGIAALVWPARIVFGYMAVWGLWTAALRPLTGEPVWELLERAGNYGVPAALLMMAGLAGTWRGWWTRIGVDDVSPGALRPAMNVLRASAALLFVGHAAFGLEGRAVLGEHYATVGLGHASVPIVGGFELGMAAALAAAAAPALYGLAAVWKVGTEMLYPLAGAPVWEFVERSGSYAAPLAVSLLLVGLRGRAARPSPAAVPGRPARGHLAGAALVVIGVLLPMPGVAQSSPAQSSPARSSPATDLLRELRGGGLVLACRHAITDRTQGGRGRPDVADRRTQRNLSASGEEQARRLGREIARLDIPIGVVLTSPWARTKESAELTFGRAEASDLLHGEPSIAELRPLFAGPTDGSGNRVLMTHQYMLRRVLPGFSSGEIREGDCVVVRPGGGGRFDVVARVGPGGWGGSR